MLNKIDLNQARALKVTNNGSRIISRVLYVSLWLLLLSCKENSSTIESSSVKPASSSESKILDVTDTFTVAFYNVENLFDTRFEGSEYPEYNPNMSNWDEKMAHKKTSTVADVITAMHPDIIGLCEVESYRSLKQLKKFLKDRGLDYKYSVIGDQPVKTNTCTALLSKYPVKKSQMHEVRMDNGKTSRNIIESDITFKNSVFKVFVNHWPSKMNSEQDRIIAAKVLKQRLDTIGTSCESIIIGDFNINYDEYRNINSSDLQLLQKNGLNHILGTVADMSGRVNLINENDMISQLDGYYDLWLELRESDRMSEVHKGFNQTLDHIIIDRLLFDNKGISYIDNSYHVFTWNGKLLRGNIPFRWEWSRQSSGVFHTGNGYSDHLPIMASFTGKPFTDKEETHNIDTAEKTFSRTDSTGITRAQFSPATAHWIPCNTNVSLTEKSDEGREFTRLVYKSGSRNITIARKSIKVTGPVLTLQLRGSGRISIRIRQPLSDWIYFNGPAMNKGMKSARYENTTIDKWTTFRLKLPENYKDTTLEMEIRAGKEFDFSFDIQ